MTIAHAWLGAALLFVAGCEKPPRSTPTILLELDADGAVRADGRPVDLNELAAHMRARRGGAPSGETADGRWLSSLDVVLRVTPDAYWQHVQLLLTVSSECNLDRTWFERTDGRRLKMFQPVNMAIEFLPGYPRKNTLCVTIDIEHSADGGALFRCGTRTATRAEAVRDWANEALKQPGKYALRVAEIRAPAKTRFRHVRAVMEALADTDIARTWFYGTMIPTKAARKSRRLPAPKSDWAPRSGLGVRVVRHDTRIGIVEEHEAEPPR